MADLEVVRLTSAETHPLRLAVLRSDTPTREVTFPDDDLPGTVHLGVRSGGEIVAVSTWIPRPYGGRPAVQLRGMATSANLQGRGVGGILVEAGCEQAAVVAPLVWARARDTALAFYVRHGFTVDGDGFVDDLTAKPHHFIIRNVPENPSPGAARFPLPAGRCASVQGMSTAAEVEQLRARAGALRLVARRIGAGRAITAHRLAGPETWVGPLAQSCLDELVAIRRELESGARLLDDAARRLDRHADELLRRAVLAVVS